MENGANVHVDNDAPLREAVDKRHTETVKVLLENGANVQVMGNYNIKWAALLGFLDILKVLVDNGADVHVNNGSVFYFACMSGNFEMVKYLEKMGVNMRGVDDEPFKQALMSCNNHRQAGTKYGNYLEIIYFMTSKGIPIELVSDIPDDTVSQSLKHLVRRYIGFRKRVEERIRQRIRQTAAKKIYFWWIPICYDLKRECGKRMRIKNYENFVRLCT